MSTNSKPLVLVTGGAGYVGCMLIPSLLRRGYRVRVFDIMFYGDAGLRSVHDQIEVIEGDIRNCPPDLLQGVDAIINLAGLSTEPAAEYRPEANQEINFEACVALAREAKKRGVRRFVQASSGSIYDVGAGHADRDILHTEDFPVQPFRIYSITKREAEKVLLSLADPNFSPVVIRKGSIYGYSPRMRLDLVVNTFVLQAMKTGALTLHNGGEMWRPLLSIQDAVAAYELMLEAPSDKVGGQIFNITNGNFRISELALRVQHKLRELGIACELRPDYEFRNLRSCQMSGRKVHDSLGFTPKVTVEEVVADLVAKIKSGVLDTENPAFHNIRWLDLLEQHKAQLGYQDTVLRLGPKQLAEVRAAALAKQSAVACG